jgi:putative FmdB family regulatory protein
MPIYVYECSRCHRTEERLRPIAHRNDPVHCDCKRGGSCDFRRAIRKEVVGSTDLPYSKPIYSDAAGVMPHQVESARKRNPEAEYLDDGRMVFRSHKQRERTLREIGMVDLDGYN